MYRNTKFSARFSTQDQDLLVHVAACLHRTKSDTVRILIYEKADELGLTANWPPPYAIQQDKRRGRN